ncbi:MAG: rRNA maturation RNase YbeY [Candidatus Onthomorpha sp.]|nr:rRNA maturation RNase YbeY [Bacteroidales bacterium]MDY3978188.1 rRNA maturation RNase YbeY [Candidatus Onthomorpha sp.]MCI6644515.1 rRNA maturation RNase YbeY [Bacteroidales bacterium]MCI6800807.1 rRNA maturation RNase YbeY [Bacteroidales bacterium]MCI6901741.1 rRNA maturation RNase YbeY [Bacteroidales bacterium]
MAIQFSFQTNYPLKSRTKIKQWIKQVIEAKGKKTGNITYIFCDDEYLLEVNKQYLQHDYYTDVITFDYVENDLISGDIFISTDRVRENALAFGSSETEELHRVIIHGALHLLGLKDKSEKEASQMRQAENEALKLLNE